MKWKRLALGFVLLLGVGPSSLAAVLWSEGFEAGAPSGWSGAVVNSTAGSHTGSKRGEIEGPATGEFFNRPISTVGYTDLALAFWFRINESTESGDLAALSWWSGGVERVLESYDGFAAGNWEARIFPLPPAASNQPTFRLGLAVNFDSASDRISFDDFQLTGIPIPEPGLVTFTLGLAVWLRQRRSPA